MPKSKAVSKTKSKTNKGLVRGAKFKFDKTLLIVTMAVLAVGAGWLWYKGSHAATYSNLVTSPSGITISACKTYTGAYGGVYQITFIFSKKTSTPAYNYSVTDARSINGTFQTIESHNSSAYWSNVAGSLKVNQSILNNDVVGAQVNSPTGGAGYGWHPSDVKNWANC